MFSSKPIALFTTAAVVGLSVVALASCGGDSSKPIASTPPPKTASGRPATVGIENSKLGKILVDTQGRTLYLFTKDSGTTSECSGACATAWPPLRVSGKPTVGNGANASLIGTTQRSDGKPQVTYNGHPVYLYEGDSKQGDTHGQGLNVFGGGWFALTPAGQQVAGTFNTGSSRGY
jgi:predicted lipoprotein with Yx(FWY)xxD motif